MPDGNTRIQVLTINSKPASTCLINLYMPSAQLNGDMEYKDTLDQISEIIDKYKETYQTRYDYNLTIMKSQVSQTGH